MKSSIRRNTVKTLITFSFITMFGFSLFAQSDKETIDLYQAAFGMQKKELISEFLKLESSNPFWAIYDSYETERKELGQKRINLISKYAEAYGRMTDAELDALIKEMMQLRTQHDKLIDTYYARVKKASGSTVAAQFYEIENYILSAIRVEIMSSIPFIGELD